MFCKIWKKAVNCRSKNLQNKAKFRGIRKMARKFTASKVCYSSYFCLVGGGGGPKKEKIFVILFQKKKKKKRGFNFLLHSTLHVYHG